MKTVCTWKSLRRSRSKVPHARRDRVRKRPLLSWLQLRTINRSTRISIAKPCVCVRNKTWPPLQMAQKRPSSPEYSLVQAVPPEGGETESPVEPQVAVEAPLEAESATPQIQNTITQPQVEDEPYYKTVTNNRPLDLSMSEEEVEEEPLYLNVARPVRVTEPAEAAEVAEPSELAACRAC